MTTFRHEGRPRVKERPRFNMKTGRAYTPTTTLKAEKLIVAAWNEQAQPLIEGPVKVTLDLFTDATVMEVEAVDYTSPLRGDIDNLAKLPLDALNGLAYEDDRQIVELTVRKHQGPSVGTLL